MTGAISGFIIIVPVPTKQKLRASLSILRVIVNF